MSFEQKLKMKYGKRYDKIFSPDFRESIKRIDECREILKPIKENLSEKIISLRNGKW